MTVKIIELNDKIRNESLNLLLTKFNNDKTIMNNVENHIFKLSNNSLNIYIQLIIKFIEHYNKDYIKNHIKNNEWKITDILSYTRDVLDPKKWQDIQDTRLPKLNKEKKKGLYKCPKCKSWYTEHTQAQTRGADEPLTTFCSCVDCEYMWKF